jgi:hypothetical protein
MRGQVLVRQEKPGHLGEMARLSGSRIAPEVGDAVVIIALSSGNKNQSTVGKKPNILQ